MPPRKYLLEYVFSLIEDEQLIMKAEVNILVAKHLVKKAWLKSTLIQPVMQPPEDKCYLIEDFAHYVSIDDSLLEEEIACLVFDDEEHRKEADECEAVNAPEVIPIGEAQKLLNQLKLFALTNARNSGVQLI
ncbi:unnamed protein product [Echinostoma caproni]|uniref:Reverse transcriptase n=1 Tax=Echinostoma caproni TaxID=27848 RepID=A0A183AZB3_9TREM|nr:unnamed protein product [Echinostoma caproni]